MPVEQQEAIETIRIQLNFPLERVKEPIVYRLVKDFDLIPNIRRANIDPHIGGFVFLELTGSSAQLHRAIEFLKEQGITVSTIGLNGAEEWVVG